MEKARRPGADAVNIRKRPEADERGKEPLICNRSGGHCEAETSSNGARNSDWFVRSAYCKWTPLPQLVRLCLQVRAEELGKLR